VDYKKTLSLAPQFSRLRKDLIRGALKLDWSSDLEKWRRTLQVTDEEIKEARRELRETGGVVLLYQNGFAPEKVPSPQWQEIPIFRSRYNKYRAAHLYLNGEAMARTEVLYDVEKVAKENLDAKYAGLIAKRVGGVVAREVLGNELDKKQQGVGTLFKMAMYMANQADTRSWLTLPQSFQLARVQVPPGKYRASIRLEDAYGNQGEERPLGEIEVKRAGDIQVLSYRSLND
jgi:hypothetical protein